MCWAVIKLQKMIVLTILNSIILIYLLIKGNNKLYITFKKEKTTWEKTLLGYSLTLWKKQGYGASGIYTIYVPVKNRRKVELSEEVSRLISDSTNRNYTLNAKFSWLKTWEQVRRFEKDYSVVDRKIVERLVANFVPKQ